MIRVSVHACRISVAVALLIVGAGCGGGSSLKVPKLQPAAAGAQAMAECDTNGDGLLDIKELQKSPGLAAALKSIDKDGNGMLSRDEIVNRITAYWQDQIAMMPMTCVVTLDGQPLAGATVTIVPEKFLGPDVKTATGLTDEYGLTGLTIGGNDGSGVQCGLFRVEISKMSPTGLELVPSQFNTTSTLGLEIATDVPDIERGIKFALSTR